MISRRNAIEIRPLGLPMEVLVDYDNLKVEMAREGLLALCSRLGDRMVSRRGHLPERCRVRLYGGWYQENHFTHRAQKLSAEIDGTFPEAISWQAKDGRGKCLTQVEMAYSLQADPGRHLFHTLRVRQFSSRLKCDSTFFDACEEQYCPMREVAVFLDQQRCPTYACTVTQSDVLSRSEQKLTDTMLASDLIFLASRGEKDLVVVSSDDDLWPGVRTAVQLGASVTVMHTGDRPTPMDYTRGVAGFEQLFL